MSYEDIQELADRNLVPADAKDHLNILRYDPRDPPTVGIFDPPTRCHTMNEEWSKHIMGAVAGLEFWKAWTGEEDELNSAVQSIYEFMVGEVCGMFLLRQNSINPCLLEQSVDGGDNWTPAFNFELCSSGGSDASIAIYIDIAIQNINTLNIAYIDAGLDITIMYPNVAYDAGPEDADRDTALCYSIEALTEGIFNAAEEVINQQISRANFFSAIISSFTGGWWANDGSLIAALSQSVTDAIFGTDALQAASDALANTNARRDVVCCIYANMEGATATFALWSVADVGCGFDPGSDQELLLAVLAPIFAGLDAYLSWVTLLSNGVDLAIADIIGNDCLTCGSWLAVIDFTSSDGGFVLNDTNQGKEFGEYDAGSGWRATKETILGNPLKDAVAIIIDLNFTGGLYRLYDVKMIFDYHKGVWSGSSQAAQAIFRQADQTIVNQSSAQEGDGLEMTTPSNEVADVATMLLFLRASLKLVTESPDGDALITGCEIRGIGDIPPELVGFIV